jgi:hypothetical protein
MGHLLGGMSFLATSLLGFHTVPSSSMRRATVDDHGAKHFLCVVVGWKEKDYLNGGSPWRESKTVGFALREEDTLR